METTATRLYDRFEVNSNDERPESPSPGVKHLSAFMTHPSAEQRSFGTLSSASAAPCAWHEHVHGSRVRHVVCPPCVEAQMTAFEAATVGRSGRTQRSDDARFRRSRA